MTKHYLLLLLALAASSTPTAVWGRPTDSNRAHQKKGKRLQARRPSYLQAGLIAGGIGVVVVVGGVCWRRSTQPKHSASLGSLFANNSALMDAVKAYVDEKKKVKSEWRNWILTKNENIKGLVKSIILEAGIDIGLLNAGNGAPAIAGIEHGGITGNVVPLEMAVILAQVLHLLKEEKGDLEAPKIVQANKNRFLANLVIRHNSNTQKVDKAQEGEVNCIPAIFVLLNLGKASPYSPCFGADEFKNGKKIIRVAEEDKGEGKAISIRYHQRICGMNVLDWIVEPVDSGG